MAFTLERYVSGYVLNLVAFAHESMEGNMHLRIATA